MGKRVLHTHKQRSGKSALRAACLLGLALLCLPLASAAGRFGVDTQDGIVEIAAGVGMQDLTLNPQPDFQLTVCQQTESTGDPRSAYRAVDPAGMLVVYLQDRDHRVIDSKTLAKIRPVLIERTAHGEISSGVTNYGRTTFHYSPVPNYTGNDKAVFITEFEGMRYKIVVSLVVSPVVGESPLMDGEEPVCPPPKLIKVNGRSVSDSSDYRLNSFAVTFGG